MTPAKRDHALTVVLLILWVVLLGGLLMLAVSVKAAPVGPFVGKFELVPLFDAGHKPVIRNGHQDYASRNTTSFRTDEGPTVTVFAGETTDLASIPRGLWALMPPDGPWAQAAIYHDACYRSHGTFDWKGRVGGRSRALPYDRPGCDEILRQAMVALGVPDWKRVTIYTAVRAFGGQGWGH